MQSPLLCYSNQKRFAKFSPELIFDRGTSIKLTSHDITRIYSQLICLKTKESDEVLLNLITLDNPDPKGIFL